MTIVLPPVVQRPTPNYTPTLIRHDLVIVHRTEGGYAGAVAWLCDPRSQASAHLVMKLDGGEVTQLVPLQYKAWAQCAFNSAGVSLEIEGYTAQGFADDTANGAALIVAWLCRAYAIAPEWAQGGQGRGVCQHHDLGSAGGGHVDCSGVGSETWLRFMKLVKTAYVALGAGPLPAFALHGPPNPHQAEPTPAVKPEPSHSGAERREPVRFGCACHRIWFSGRLDGRPSVAPERRRSAAPAPCRRLVRTGHERSAQALSGLSWLRALRRNAWAGNLGHASA